MCSGGSVTGRHNELLERVQTVIRLTFCWSLLGNVGSEILTVEQKLYFSWTNSLSRAKLLSAVSYKVWVSFRSSIAVQLLLHIFSKELCGRMIVLYFSQGFCAAALPDSISNS